MAAYDLLTAVELSSGANSVVMTSGGSSAAWSGYDFLELFGSARSEYTSAGSGEELCLLFNSDAYSTGSSATSPYKMLSPYSYNTGQSFDIYTSNGNNFYYGQYGKATTHSTSDTKSFCAWKVLLFHHDRLNSAGDQFFMDVWGQAFSAAVRQNNSDAVISYNHTQWATSAAVTTITIFPRYGTTGGGSYSGGWTAGSRFQLWGYKESNT